MSTVRKTVLRRFNGVDWDPTYLANSADITYLGAGHTVAEGNGFVIGQNIRSNATIQSLITTIIDNIAKIYNVSLPLIRSGSDISALSATKLSGNIPRNKLPSDVSGKGIEVANEYAREALTVEDVNSGDIVKVAGGKVYVVSSTSTGVPEYIELGDEESSILWSRIASTPTTLNGYGITDAVNVNNLVNVADYGTVGKILTINNYGKLSASITGSAERLGDQLPSYYATSAGLSQLAALVDSISTSVTNLLTAINNIDASQMTTGVISLDRLPHGALERLIKVTNIDAIPTTEDLQNGDSIQCLDTGIMYIVVDDTKLTTVDTDAQGNKSIEGLVPYTAGSATAVDWSGITGSTTVAASGITDAVSTSMIATSGNNNPNKLLKTNSNGKLETDIVGSATKLGDQLPSYYAKQSDMNTAESTINDTLLPGVQALTTAVGDVNSGLVKNVNDLIARIGSSATVGTILHDIANLKTGNFVEALAASKITGKLTRTQLPNDIGGKIVVYSTYGVAKQLLDNTIVNNGDILYTNEGSVYKIIDNTQLNDDAGYHCLYDGTGDIAGNRIVIGEDNGTKVYLDLNKIRNLVSTDDIIDATTIATESGKLVRTGTNGKMYVNIAGSADRFGGELPSYYATDTDLDAAVTQITALQTAIAGLTTSLNNILDNAIGLDGTINLSTATLTGTLPAANLPASAVVRNHIVQSASDLATLTVDDVQNGDTVTINGGERYVVVDDTKLNTASYMDAFIPYATGDASTVPWSGVQNKPTTLNGYGITDAINSNKLTTVDAPVTAADVGKIPVIGSDGKLNVGTNGTTLWSNISNKPSSSAAQIDAAVTNSAHTNRAILDDISGDNTSVSYKNNQLAYLTDLDPIKLGSLKLYESLPVNDIPVGQFILELISDN